MYVRKGLYYLIKMSEIPFQRQLSMVRGTILRIYYFKQWSHCHILCTASQRDDSSACGLPVCLFDLQVAPYVPVELRSC